MSAASTPGGAPKSMSSRLLTMKFMQRAANTSPTTHQPPSTDEPSPKRRRKEADSSPSTFSVDALADRKAIQAAIASEEAKRQAALERQAAEAGDTRWVLSFEDQKALAQSSALTLRVVETGFANLDSQPVFVQSMDEDTEEKPAMVGRRSFGKFNKVLEKQQNPLYQDSEDDSEEDDENDGSSDSDNDSDNPANNLIKASRQEAANKAKSERKAKRQAEKSELEKVAQKRRKKDVNLNELSSLSGNPLIGNNTKSKDISCYNCGGQHMKRDCPNQKRGHQGRGDDGPPRKAPKFK